MAYIQNNTSIIQGGTNMSGAGDIIRGLNVTTGYYLHFEAEISPTVAFVNNINGWIEQGSIVYLGTGADPTDRGKFIPGLPTNGTFVMPMMVYAQNSHAMTSRKNTVYDNTTPGFDYQFVNTAGGKITAVPLCAGYEFATTEYATTVNGAAAEYKPNTVLTTINIDTSATDVTNAQNAGRLKPGTLGTDQIVGIVSEGVRDHNGRNRKTMLCFWGWVQPSKAQMNIS